MRIALIGLGGMGKVVLNALRHAQERAGHEIVAAMVASQDLQNSQSLSIEGFPVYDQLSDLLATKPDIIAECAGHAAVREYGVQILRQGIELLIISTGALADDGLFEQLKGSASQAKTRIYIPAGAVGGIDALTAARLAGLQRVTYKAIKPALSWSGTPAEQEVDLAGLKKPHCFYRGSAREAALLFPKNSNVAATVALAGTGFDNTEVELIADPDATENLHEIDVAAKSGSFNIRLSGLPLRDSPKTSALAAYSVAKCLLDQGSAFII